MHFKFAGLVVAVLCLSATHSASAADMPEKIPVKAPMAAATAWTGFYVNGGIGYGIWAANYTTELAGACSICETQVMGGKGWLATIGAGYDYQFSPKIVAGLFGDASLSSLKGTLQDRGIGLGASGEIKQTSSWAVGARLGWLVTPQTMSYVNGGYSGARFSDTSLVSLPTGAPTGFTTPAFTANGWFLGGGMETSLSAGWFWRTEYRYAYYGNKAIVETPAANIINFKPTVQTVTTQVVYKFNGGMPAPVYPATPAMPVNWTGFNVSAGAGYGMWAADSTRNVPGLSLCTSCTTQVLGGKGWLGRVGAGYDWQFAPVWVVGVSGDFDISSLKGTIQDPGFGASGQIKQTWAWAVGPRFGWLPSPQTMTYVNGGYTGARFSDTTMVPMFFGATTGLASPAFTTTGWFLGGGVETTFDWFGILGKGWFWRSEYRYANYRNQVVTSTGSGAPQSDINFKPVVQTITSSIVFKFN